MPRSLILLCSSSRRGLKRRPGKRKLFIGRRLKGVDNRRRWNGVAAVNIPPAAHYRVPPTECKLLRLQAVSSPEFRGTFPLFRS